MSFNAGIHVQKDNNHVTREGVGAAGTDSPLTLDTTVRTITLPVSGNAITLFPTEATRIGFAAALGDGYFTIESPYTLSYSQDLLTAIYYRSDSASPDASASLGFDIGMS